METMDIYVGNLDYQLTEDDIKPVFQAYGEVGSVKIITDSDTGNSRGFCFVEMPEKEEALKAIEALNGTDLGGKTITVNEARPKLQSKKGRGGPGGGRGGFGNSTSGSRGGPSRGGRGGSGGGRGGPSGGHGKPGGGHGKPGGGHRSDSGDGGREFGNSTGGRRGGPGGGHGKPGGGRRSDSGGGHGKPGGNRGGPSGGGRGGSGGGGRNRY